jgi:hypothetical protein
VTTLAVRPPDARPWTAELQELDRHACQVLHEHVPDRPSNADGRPVCAVCRCPWPCPPVLTADLNRALLR